MKIWNEIGKILWKAKGETMFIVFVHCLFNLFRIIFNTCVVSISFILKEVFARGIGLENIWASSLENTGDGVIYVFWAIVLLEGFGMDLMLR